MTSRADSGYVGNNFMNCPRNVKFAKKFSKWKYRIVGNFCWCKFSRENILTLQKKFRGSYFHGMRDTLTTTLPVDATSSDRLLQVGILYNRRLILLYSNHLEGRQTTENHLVPTYAHNDIINFHLSSFFFVVFIFAEAGLSVKIMKICTQWKFPAIW